MRVRITIEDGQDHHPISVPQHLQPPKGENGSIVVEHRSTLTVLEAVEDFLLKSIPTECVPPMMPSAMRAAEGERNARNARQRAEDILEGKAVDIERLSKRVIAADESRADAVRERTAACAAADTWRDRFTQALEIISEMQAQLPGSRFRWPRGLRKRLSELRDTIAPDKEDTRNQ